MKCANCGSDMRYDVSVVGLVCDYCGTVKNLPKPEDEQVIEDMDFGTAIRGAATDWGISRRPVECKSCGASMFYPPEQMSGICPYCGSSVVVSGEEADLGMAPNAIIPFTMSREEITARFYRWNKFAFWAPEKFRKGKVLENLVPIYIPYWTFEADTVTTYEGRFGYTREVGESTKTNWYQRTGVLEKHLEGITACAGRKFRNDRMLNSVIAFDEGDLIEYSPDVLSGMAAEVYTIGVDEAWKEVKTKGLRKRLMSAVSENEHADHCEDLKCSTEYSNIRFKYVLVPVWLAGAKHNGKIYNVVASGYNGRGNCTRPLSVMKIVMVPVIFLAILILGAITRLLPVFIGLLTILVMAAFIGYIISFALAFADQRENDRKKGR